MKDLNKILNYLFLMRINRKKKHMNRFLNTATRHLNINNHPTLQDQLRHHPAMAKRYPNQSRRGRGNSSHQDPEKNFFMLFLNFFLLSVFFILPGISFHTLTALYKKLYLKFEKLFRGIINEFFRVL